MKYFRGKAKGKGINLDDLFSYTDSEELNNND